MTSLERARRRVRRVARRLAEQAGVSHEPTATESMAGAIRKLVTWWRIRVRRDGGAA